MVWTASQQTDTGRVVLITIEILLTVLALLPFLFMALIVMLGFAQDFGSSVWEFLTG